MLKSSKYANKTMRSIQNIITDRKRDKKIDDHKTTLALYSDKQKRSFKENTENKKKKLSHA